VNSEHCIDGTRLHAPAPRPASTRMHRGYSCLSGPRRRGRRRWPAPGGGAGLREVDAWYNIGATSPVDGGQ